MLQTLTGLPSTALISKVADAKNNIQAVSGLCGCIAYVALLALPGLVKTWARCVQVVDPHAGSWPTEQAEIFAELALKCCELR